MYLIFSLLLRVVYCLHIMVIQFLVRIVTRPFWLIEMDLIASESVHVGWSTYAMPIPQPIFLASLGITQLPWLRQEGKENTTLREKLPLLGVLGQVVIPKYYQLKQVRPQKMSLLPGVPLYGFNCIHQTIGTLLRGSLSVPNKPVVQLLLLLSIGQHLVIWKLFSVMFDLIQQIAASAIFQTLPQRSV